VANTAISTLLVQHSTHTIEGTILLIVELKGLIRQTLGSFKKRSGRISVTWRSQTSGDPCYSQIWASCPQSLLRAKTRAPWVKCDWTSH